MIINQRTHAPRYKRDNIESFLLVSASTSGAEHLAVTLVEMEPGGFQHLHAHVPEQMYYILAGTGEMTVDGETKKVGRGDCIFFPSGSAHGLKNTGHTKLKYLSAASPSFTKEQCEQWWPLKSLSEEESGLTGSRY